MYAATIPGQASDAIVAFYVQATDGFTPAAVGRFPRNAPTDECLVHYGDAQPFGAYGTYRFWLTRASYIQWVTSPVLSNLGNPGTFVYGNSRVIYNATERFGGSPFHAPLLDTPDGTNCDYYVSVPGDDTFLNANSFTLQTPGNFGRAKSKFLSVTNRRQEGGHALIPDRAPPRGAEAQAVKAGRESPQFIQS